MNDSNSSPPTASLRGFWSLFVTQFQGAFSDNVLKSLVIFMLIGMDVSLDEKHRIGELVGALFSLPFILFSMAGGYLADRFSKRTISVGVKVFEMGVMTFALAGFALHQMPMLLAAVLLMGVHSAFFGPSKYGLLPELLPEKKLSWGNGLLELGTFMAIILGTVAAAVLSRHFGARQFRVRAHPCRAGLLRIRRQPRHHPGARRRSRKEIPRQFHRRRFRATALDARRPSARPGPRRQYLLQLSRRLAPAQPVLLRRHRPEGG